MPPNIEALKKLQGMIQRTTTSIPKIQDKAIETGDFTELRRVQGVVKQLSGLADRLTSQQEGPAPNVPAPVQPPTPAPAPEPPQPGIGSLAPQRIKPVNPAEGSETPPAPKSDAVIVKPGEYKQPDGSIKDFIKVEIPKAIYDLSQLAGKIAGEQSPDSRYVPEWALGRSEAPPDPGVQHGGLPIKAEYTPPAPAVMPTGDDKRQFEATRDQIPAQESPAVMPTGNGSILDLIPQDKPKFDTATGEPLPEPGSPGKPYFGHGLEEEAQEPGAPGKPWFGHGLEPVVEKAKELGESPDVVLNSVLQEAQATPGDDAEKEFLSRVKMLGLDRRVPTWERFITALAYGAANIFSRWVSRNWRMPLNFADLYAQDRRDDETRRQLAIQMLSERAADRRQKTSLDAAATRQKEAGEVRKRVAEIQATARAGRAKAKDAVAELNRTLDAVRKVNGEKARVFDAQADAILTRIKAADQKLKSYMTPGPAGMMMPNDARLKAEGFVDAAGNADMGPLYTEHDKIVTPLYEELEKLRRDAASSFGSTPQELPR